MLAGSGSEWPGMHRPAALALTLTMLATSAVRTSALAQMPAMASPAEIQHSLDAYTNTIHHSGVIAGIVQNGVVSVYRSGDFGPGQPPLDDRTIFQIGSLTKTFTATLLASMVVDGQVKLDQTVQSVAPSGVTIPSYHGQQITFANLAGHNSGLPRLPSNLATDAPNPYAAYTPALFAQFLSGYTLTRAPGDRYEYSNAGAGLLGDALAWSAERPYDQLLESRVLQPLGLRDTTLALTPDQSARLAPGLTQSGTPSPPWTFGELQAAGGLYSDMHDMLAYLQANLAAPSGPLGAAMAMAQTPRTVDDSPHGETKTGLIWIVNVRNGNTFMNGETGGYHSFMLLNRDANTGIVVLANVADSNVDALALHALYPALIAAPVSSAANTNSLPEDPAVAALARSWLLGLRSGTIDRSKLTPEFSQHVTGDMLHQISTSLTSMGELSGWTFLGAQKNGDYTVYRYRVLIGSQSHVWSVTIDASGKIAGSLLQ
jgi:D-alanyl-D-alanine-carboxypeptidase/D-alanyl-D-alanine-endopeptidase